MPVRFPGAVCVRRPAKGWQALARWPDARVVLEAGSQSAWIAWHLTSRGFDVHVVDPWRVQLISKDPRKTDRRDAELLARLESGMPELLGRVYHRGEQAQADLALIRARDQLVCARTSLVQCVRGLAKSFGLRFPSASTTAFAKRVRELVPAALLPAVEVVLAQVEALTTSIRELDRRIARVTKDRYPEVAAAVPALPSLRAGDAIPVATLELAKDLAMARTARGR